MKTLAYPNRMICVLIVSIVLSFSIQTELVSSGQENKWVPVDQNSIASILTMIGDRVRENHNKLITWQGKIKFVTDDINRGTIAEKMFRERLKDDGQPIPNIIIEHQDFFREFALDANKGLLYEHYYPDGQNHYIVDENTGRRLQLKENVHLGNGILILTPDSHIDCMKNRNRDGVIVSRTVIKQNRPQGKVSCQSQLPPVFDPRETMRVFGNPIWETLANYLAYIDKDGLSSKFQGHTVKVEVEECNVGDVKKYKIILPAVSSIDHVYHLFTLFCSSEAGFNVISYLLTVDNERVLEDKTWDYELISGVYLPVKKRAVRYDLQGNLNSESTYTFMEQKVNKSIPEEVFTYKNLGLKDGDKFIDKILDKEYSYQNGELIPIVKKVKKK